MLCVPLFAGSLGAPWYKIDRLGGGDYLGNPTKSGKTIGQFALTTFTDCRSSVPFLPDRCDYVGESTISSETGYSWNDDDDLVGQREDPGAARLKDVCLLGFLPLLACLVSSFVGFARAQSANCGRASARGDDMFYARWQRRMCVHLSVQALLAILGTASFMDRLPEYVDSTVRGVGSGEWMPGAHLAVAGTIFTLTSLVMRAYLSLACEAHARATTLPSLPTPPPIPTQEEALAEMAAGVMQAMIAAGSVRRIESPAEDGQEDRAAQQPPPVTNATAVQAAQFSAMLAANPQLAAIVMAHLATAGYASNVPLGGVAVDFQPQLQYPVGEKAGGGDGPPLMPGYGAVQQGYGGQGGAPPQGYGGQGGASPQGYGGQGGAPPQGYGGQGGAPPQGDGGQGGMPPHGYGAGYGAQQPAMWGGGGGYPPYPGALKGTYPNAGPGAGGGYTSAPAFPNAYSYSPPSYPPVFHPSAPPVSESMQGVPSGGLDPVEAPLPQDGPQDADPSTSPSGE